VGILRPALFNIIIIIYSAGNETQELASCKELVFSHEATSPSLLCFVFETGSCCVARLALSSSHNFFSFFGGTRV
jgi:hypothetical protein